MGKDDQDGVPSHVVGTIGSLEEYHLGDDWSIYEERLEEYFKANVIPDNRKVSVLITLIGQTAYKILKDVCDPILPRDKTFDDLKIILNKQFAPAISIFRKRIEFYNCRQDSQESINDWFVKVKRAAVNCKFGSTLENILSDKFITGMKKGLVLDRVCEEEHGKSLKHYVEIALKKESAILQSEKVMVNKVVERKNGVEKNFKSMGPRRDYSRNKEEPARREFSKTGEKDDSTEKKCYVCGRGNHNFARCRYKGYRCKNCSKLGHLSNVCKFKKGNAEVKVVEHDDVNFYKFIDCYNIYESFRINLKINGISIVMEMDTGSGLTLIPYKLYLKHFRDVELKRCSTILTCYDKTKIVPKGQVNCKVEFKNVCKCLNLIVVDSDGPPLLGRDGIKELNILKGWQENLNSLKTDTEIIIKDLLNEYEMVFSTELGCYKHEKIKLELVEGAKPTFLKPRQIPFAFKEAVEKELDRLEGLGVIYKLDSNLWGTPLVPVFKKDKSVRLCADYRVTVNKYLKDVNYPIPKIEELFAAMQGGKVFTKLDLSQAYNQLRVDVETGKLLAWSTHRGIYAVKRLPYGTKPACAIFQRIIETTLQGCNGTVTFMDDILITGKNLNEHIENLKNVFEKLKEAGLTVSKTKCHFFEKEVKYLGYIISEQGLKKDMSKIDAIVKAKVPTNTTEVKSFIGMVNYYGKFIKNLANILQPLYNLLKLNEKFEWSKKCESSFKLAKEAITSDDVLVHYNSEYPIRLTCDASQYGIGAVLEHVFPDGVRKPIGFVSRVLSSAEKNYSMIDKEALAIFYGVKKFSQYLLGRSFELYTDHKPLLALFGERKGIPQMAAERIQRWALYLSNFNYTIRYIKGKNNETADALSRLPIVDNDIQTENDLYTYLNFVENAYPIDIKKLQIESRNDVEISTVIRLVRYGWDNYEHTEGLKQYFVRREQLTLEQNVLMWGYRVVIPKKFRKKLLEELHSSHMGVVRMKSKARQYFWWPGLDKEIEEVARNCGACVENRANPNRSQVQPWKRTGSSFERIHVEYLGPFFNKIFLVVIDTFSKWPEVVEVKIADSKNTIEKLREIFSRLGLPKTLVSDNGTQFTALEFKEFCKINNINHMLSPPYHPASNGAAENVVKSFKLGIRKALKDTKNKNISIQTLVSRYLFNYRTTIHPVTGDTPAKLMLGRELRNRFDLLIPNTQNVSDGQKIVGKGRIVNFEVGNKVLVRDYRNRVKPGWIKAEIIEVLGNNVYECHIEELGVNWKRHKDQIWKNDSGIIERERVEEVIETQEVKIDTTINEEDKVKDLENAEIITDIRINEEKVKGQESAVTEVKPQSAKSDSVKNKVTVKLGTEQSIANNRPRRICKPPDKLNL